MVLLYECDLFYLVQDFYSLSTPLVQYLPQQFCTHFIYNSYSVFTDKHQFWLFDS